MTLTLITAPSPTQSYPSGMISIRCEDYVGPARGTLTTAADSDSVAGTVVVDTQDIAVSTTLVSFTTRYGLASDTLRIPWTDITSLFPASTLGAFFFVSMKVTGDIPDNGNGAGATYLRWLGSGQGPGMAFGRDTTLLSTGYSVWRGEWGPQYMITGPQFLLQSDMTGTNFVLRVWGITGGSMSYSLDVLYVVPARTDFFEEDFPSNFPVFLPVANGVMLVDEDDDSSNVSIGGDQSVTSMASNPCGEITAYVDLQSANDEPTYWDLNGGGTWDGSLDPPGADPESWLSMMAAPIYLPAQNFITDSFPNSHTGAVVNTVVTTPQAFLKTLGFGNFTPSPIAGDGWSETGGAAVCHLPANQTAAATAFVGADLTFANAELATGSGTDPDDRRPTMFTLEDQIQTFTFSFDAVTEQRILCGRSTQGNASSDVSVGALLELSGGSLDLSLVNTDIVFSTDPNVARNPFDGPVTITGSYNANDVYHLKVESRRYQWRAKCWLDGTGEPGWQVDGFMYMVSLATGGVSPDWIAHPYDTNWVGDATHDIIRVNPLDNRGAPFVRAEVAAGGQGTTNLSVYEYALDVDPDGTDTVDMHVQETKYDGTVWDSVTVPYSTKQSWRFIEGSIRQRNFNADTNGFNLHCWKDTGAPALQVTSIPWAFLRAKVQGGVIPLFRPRVFSVSDV